MKDSTRAKFISDVKMEEQGIKVRRPFKLSSEKQRRFVRLEISSPMSLKKIKDIFGNLWPQGTGFTIEGTILNISVSGVLVEIDQPLNEGDIVAMRFTLQGVETLENVLGIVKRTDQDETVHLAGIEFVNKEHLADKLSQAEMEMLAENLSDFQGTIHDVLKKYIHREASPPHA
jgi:hypothetical protein